MDFKEKKYYPVYLVPGIVHRTGEFLRGIFGQTFYQILCPIWIEEPMTYTFAGTGNVWIAKIRLRFVYSTVLPD